ncbi:MAG: hypothetical protein ACI4J1_07055 [Ruminiclostridium sp.]
MEENKTTENGFEQFGETSAFPDPTVGNDTFSSAPSENTQGVFPEQQTQDFSANGQIPPQSNAYQQPQYDYSASPNMEMPQNNYTNVTTYQTYGDSAAKKSKAPIFIAVAAILFAAAAAVVLFMLFGNNQSYEKAERNFVNQVFAALDAAAESESSSVGEMTFTPTEALTDLIGCGPVNPTVIKADVSKSGENLSGYFQILNGTKPMLTFKEWLSDSKLVFLIPEISPLYISGDVAANTEEQEAREPVDYETFKKACSAFLDKYFLIVGDVKPEKSVPVTSNGITVKCDVYTITYNKLFEAQLKLALCETIKEYPQLIDVINKYAGENIDEEIIDRNIEDAKETIDELKEDGGEVKGTIVAYVAGGKIVGREYKSADGSESFKYIALEADENYSAEVSYSKGENKNITVTDTGKSTSAGRTGTLSITSASTDLDKFTCTVDYTDLIYKDNHLSGKFSAAVPSSSLNIDGSFSYEGTTDTAELDIFVGGTKYGTIALSTTKNENVTVEPLPQLTAENSVDTDNKDDPNDDKFTEDLNAFITNLDTKFADDNGKYEIIYASVKSIINAFSSTSNDWDDNSDDDYDDDYDNDWDDDYDDNWDDDTDDNNGDDFTLSETERAEIEELLETFRSFVKEDGSFDSAAYFESIEAEVDISGYEDFYSGYFLLTIDVYQQVLDGEISIDEAYSKIDAYFEEYADYGDGDYGYNEEDFTGEFGDYISADDIQLSIGGKSYDLKIPASAFIGKFPSIETDALDEISGQSYFSKDYYDETFTLDLYFSYYGENPPAVKDHYVSSIYCYDGCDKDYLLAANGITIGSTEEELLNAMPDATYSTDYGYAKNYSYYTEDYSVSLSFTLEDGAVSWVSYSYSDPDSYIY